MSGSSFKKLQQYCTGMLSWRGEFFCVKLSMPCNLFSVTCKLYGRLSDRNNVNTLAVVLSRFKSKSRRPSISHNPTVQRYAIKYFLNVCTPQTHTHSCIPPTLFGNTMGLIDLTYPLSEDDKSIWPGNHPFRYPQRQGKKKHKYLRKSTVSEGADNPMDCFIAHVSGLGIFYLKWYWHSTTSRRVNKTAFLHFSGLVGWWVGGS